MHVVIECGAAFLRAFGCGFGDEGIGFPHVFCSAFGCVFFATQHLVLMGEICRFLRAALA